MFHWQWRINHSQSFFSAHELSEVRLANGSSSAFFFMYSLWAMVSLVGRFDDFVRRQWRRVANDDTLTIRMATTTR